MDRKLQDRVLKAVNAKDRTNLGSLTREDKVLLVVPPHQDKELLDAILEALRDKGVSSDVAWEHDLVGIDRDELGWHTSEEGWKELINFQESMAQFLISRGIVEAPRTKSVTLNLFMSALGDYVRKNPKYTAIHAGTGGLGHFRRHFGENAQKFRGHWEYISKEVFFSPLQEFHAELIKLIDEKTFELVGRAEELRVTDPAGTYFICPVSEEDAWIWEQSMPSRELYYNKSHLSMYPLQSFRVMSRSVYSEKVAVIPKSYGVVAGTSGHYGFYPHLQVYIRDGFIYRIEGGGKMGDLLRDVLERTREIQYPSISKPGYMYVNGLALGTIPKGFRTNDIFGTTDVLPNVWERLRSGTIHWDMGAEHYSQTFLKFARENNLPEKHSWHIHTYFNTYDIRLRDTKEWVKLIDKGHLTALDHPEVRAEAGKYGDPDELLKEEWTPKLPGINYPGDYMRDYGNDPFNWVRKEKMGLLPETIGVPRSG